MLVRFDPYSAPSIHGSSWAFSSDPLPSDWEDLSKDCFGRIYTTADTDDEDEARAIAIIKFTAYLEKLDYDGEGSYRHLIPLLHEPDQIPDWRVSYETR